MQLFLNLFEPHLQWFYHCFDRLVVNGYLSYFFLESHVVYFILCSMEQGSTFAIRRPKFPTQDSNYRILRKQRSRFLHYY